LSMKSCIFSSYCRVGRITREFPLSAEATVASLWMSFVWIDFNILSSGCVLLWGDFLWISSMRVATCFLK